MIWESTPYYEPVRRSRLVCWTIERSLSSLKKENNIIVATEHWRFIVSVGNAKSNEGLDVCENQNRQVGESIYEILMSLSQNKVLHLTRWLEGFWSSADLFTFASRFYMS